VVHQLVQVDLQLTGRQVDGDELVGRGDRLTHDGLEQVLLHVAVDGDRRRRDARDRVEQAGQGALVEVVVDQALDGRVDGAADVVDRRGSVLDDGRVQEQVQVGHAVLAEATHAV